MTYLIAAVSLGAACVLWYLVQRWAEPDAEPSRRDGESDCADCGLREAGCPDVPAPAAAPAARGLRGGQEGEPA